MTQPIKVLLCDDHTVFRSLVKAILREAPSINVVAEAGDGKQGLDKALLIRPDVVVMDLNMYSKTKWPLISLKPYRQSAREASISSGGRKKTA